jgi:hypothetical protein
MDCASTEGLVEQQYYRNRVEQKVVKLYMGKDREHVVFEAKMAAAAIGGKLLKIERGRRYVIAADNQAAIQTTWN